MMWKARTGKVLYSGSLQILEENQVSTDWRGRLELRLWRHNEKDV